jgi:UDP-N-acetylmuramate dehydrogenase
MARAIDREGREHVLHAGDMGFSYRHTEVPEDYIFVSAVLAGVPADPAAVKARMAEIGSERELSQPVKTSTGGSTFKNPGKNPEGARAWQLIDAAGCRGLRVGGAQVSEQHCNFLINTGDATAADLEALGEAVRRRVRDSQGVELEWEIRRIGEARS